MCWSEFEPDQGVRRKRGHLRHHWGVLGGGPCGCCEERRAILARLSKSVARVTELAEAFPISLNFTSKHIRKLERAGLVKRTISAWMPCGTSSPAGRSGAVWSPHAVRERDVGRSPQAIQ